MKLFLILFVLPLLADSINPNFYQMEAPCDGYTLGDYEHGGCIIGEIRFFGPQGTVLTRMLEWTPQIVQNPLECDGDCYQPPIDPPTTPDAPIVPPPTVVPEPGYFLPIAILAGLASKRKWSDGMKLLRMALYYWWLKLFAKFLNGEKWRV